MSLGYINAQNLAQISAVDELMRARKIRTAWEAYHGTGPKPLKNKPGQVDDNVCVNLPRLSVDTSAFFLFGKDLSFEISDDEQDTTGNDGTSAETPADVYLDNVWAANKQQTLLLKIGLNGAVCGHAFAKLLEPRGGEEYPRLINLDPACMRVEWMPDDIEAVYRYVYEYTAFDPVSRKNLNYRQTTERTDNGQWQVIDEVSDPDSTRWQETARNAWPYDWPPIIDCQNLPTPNEFWGVSDLEEDVQELATASNFVLSNTNRIIRFHAHPKTIGKGFAAADLKTGPDQTTILPSADADLFNLEMQSDLASSIEHYHNVKAAYHETTQVPEVTTGKFDNIGQLSGLAIQLLYGPILQRTEVKRRTYGDMLRELNRRILAFGGFGEENLVETHWPVILPSDPQGEATTLQTHLNMGVVSKETVQEKLGYDPETERPKIAAEKQAAVSAAQQTMAENQSVGLSGAQGIQQDVPPTF
jgi:hypothetical protein